MSHPINQPADAAAIAMMEQPEYLRIAANAAIVTGNQPVVHEDLRETAWQILHHNKARAKRMGISFAQLLHQARHQPAMPVAPKDGAA